MKKKNILLMVMSVFFAITSCELEEEVYSSIYTENFYKTASDAEAAITAAVVAVPLVLRATRRGPQSLCSQSPSVAVRRGALTLSAAALLALALSPFASELPDGLESVGRALAPASGGAAPLLPSLFGDYALHGAPWRQTWGVPQSNGCVSMPTPAAKFVYDWAPVGTPVTVHY